MLTVVTFASIHYKRFVQQRAHQGTTETLCRHPRLSKEPKFCEGLLYESNQVVYHLG